jgi:hypothetical protein
LYIREYIQKNSYKRKQWRPLSKKKKERKKKPKPEEQEGIFANIPPIIFLGLQQEMCQ